MCSLVSIIVPSYNQGRFIEATIRSVQEQTYRRIEYLVYDAESTDSTQEVLERYRDHIDYLHIGPDDGQTDAISKGFRRAKGSLVGWINSDDFLAPTAVAAAVAAFHEHPSAALVYGDLTLIDEAAESLDTLCLPPRMSHDELLNGRLGQRFYMAQPGSFYRKSAVEAAGGLRNEFHLLMDKDLWLRLLKQGPGYHTGEVGAFFRKHASAKTDRISTRFVSERWQLRREHRARWLGHDSYAHAKVIARCILDRLAPR
jgi:glycosyltransferase involved in cell wall biosynthesis